MFNDLLNESLLIENELLQIENENKEIWIECMNLEFTNFLNEADGNADNEEIAKPNEKVKISLIDRIKKLIEAIKTKIADGLKKAANSIDNRIKKLQTVVKYNKKIKINKKLVDNQKVFDLIFKNADIVYATEENMENLRVATEAIENGANEVTTYVEVAPNVLQNLLGKLKKALVVILNGLKKLINKLLDSMNKVKNANSQEEIAEASKETTKESKTLREVLKSFFSVFRKTKVEDSKSDKKEEVKKEK